MSLLGSFHTALGLLALASGIAAYALHRGIRPRRKTGLLYLASTLLVSLTGFGLFAHGGFGKPHALAVLTLLTLAFAYAAGSLGWFGAAGRKIETVGYSFTFFLHFIPGITETFTRLPAGNPAFDSPEAPALKAIAGLLFLLFLAGARYQLKAMPSELRGQ
ncbi:MULTISPECIES: hypothetical protein [unclassified Duganella]|uniref:hypothetical protein n=1 Tax=unclassified Duganella TaxID=2636909 RepID=UPI0007014B52|nr:MULTISPECIES: hypothetical protein [unclassified Duganella]KQV61961.1 hypothetical protein ASD07_03265 [Duganella sp. Root336D2]KRB84434.1 hypothetical protein ASE26_09940 [Duganella sp. Root198D2]